jgi:hypothetical protein
MTKENEIIKNEENTSVTVSNSSDYSDYKEDGFDNISNEDLSIPFISLLQPNSVLVVDGEVEGAKGGAMVNTVTNQIYDPKEGLVVVPCFESKNYVEWIAKDAGGGFVGIHETGSEFVTSAIESNGSSYGKIPVESDDGKLHELVETKYVYCLILNQEGTETDGFCVINFSSTKIKACKDWFTSMYMLKNRPPLFANRAVIKSEKKQKDGNTWFTYKIEPLKSTWKDSLISPSTEKHLLDEGNDFREMIQKGEKQANFEKQDSSNIDSSGDNIPF